MQRRQKVRAFNFELKDENRAAPLDVSQPVLFCEIIFFSELKLYQIKDTQIIFREKLF